MKANSSETVEEIMERVSQADILSHYFHITSLPVLINSPLRDDKHPSFSIYSPDGEKVKFIDYATGERGDIYNLMQKSFNLSFPEVMRMIGKDKALKHTSTSVDFHATPSLGKKFSTRTSSDIKVKVREWQQHDIDYWQSYGISLSWLKYAEVYPISHKIIYKDDNRYVFPAAKYAYCFVERKEEKVTLKVYQPLSKLYKWSNKNDASVVGLWTKIPQQGDSVVICSSLKDALCLWANIGIPCVYVQSETTMMSDTAQQVLKSRFKHVYVCFDNDKPGLEDAKNFSRLTGFKNIILPSFDGGKDISDFYRLRGKEEFIKTIKPLFNEIDSEQESQECHSPALRQHTIQEQDRSGCIQSSEG